MAELTVDLTYGKALFDASFDLNKTEEILEEGKAIVKILKDNPEFNEFLISPVISVAEKKLVVQNIFKNQVSSEMVNFLCVLIDKGRSRHFEKIIERYKHLINDSKGFTTGTIFSFNPLNESQIDGIEEKTGALLKKKIKLDNKTDSKIIGGIRIFIDGKVIDATIKKRLLNMKETLR